MADGLIDGLLFAASNILSALVGALATRLLEGRLANSRERAKHLRDIRSQVLEKMLKKMEKCKSRIHPRSIDVMGECKPSRLKISLEKSLLIWLVDAS